MEALVHESGTDLTGILGLNVISHKIQFLLSFSNNKKTVTCAGCVDRESLTPQLWAKIPWIIQKHFKTLWPYQKTKKQCYFTYMYIYSSFSTTYTFINTHIKNVHYRSKGSRQLQAEYIFVRLIKYEASNCLLPAETNIVLFSKNVQETKNILSENDKVSLFFSLRHEIVVCF
jgi:hypothetical protein